MKTYFVVKDDSYYSFIEHYPSGLGIEPDGYKYFNSFKDAKRRLKKLLKDQLDNYRDAYSRANKLTIGDIRNKEQTEVECPF